MLIPGICTPTVNPRFRPADFLLVCVVSLILAPGARAQTSTGAFQPASSWWQTGFSIGVSTDGTTLSIDTNGNGVIDPSDHTHPHPSAIVGATIRLTPSRTVLHATKAGTGACTGGTETWFYEIPATDGAPLVLLAGPICIPNQVAHQGFFDQPGVYEQRIAYIADRVPLAGITQQVLWVDLETGTNSWTDFAFDENIGFVQFSPSGVAAFVQHDVSDEDNLANYSVVELCPGSLGHTYNPAGGTLQQIGPNVAMASVVDQGGGNLAAVVTWPDTLSVQATVPINDCTGSTPAVGACCLSDGGCMAGVTAGECSGIGGTYAGDGTDCAGAGCPPPPNAVLSLTKSGPATVLEGQNITYTLQYGNSGNLSSEGVLVADYLPPNVTFVSATDNGVYDSGLNRVLWSLGSVPPSTSSQLQMTINVPCGLSQISNDNYFIFGNPGGGVLGSPAVVTTVQSQSGALVTVVVTSTPQAPEPLGDFDQILHEVTLINTVATLRESLYTTNIALSNVENLVQIVDDAGGTVTTSPSAISWKGNLNPSATVTLSFLTEIDECRLPSSTQAVLNSGSPIRVFNACGIEVGSGTASDTLQVGPPPITVELVPINAGPPQLFPQFLGGVWMALVRGGAALEFEARIHNTGTVAKSVNASFPFPAELQPSGNPPFVGTPPSGTTWDDPTRTISYSGILAGNTSLIIEFAAMLDSTASCRVPIYPVASTGACSNNISGVTHLLAVPPPPAGDFVFGVFPYGDGTWYELGSMLPETVFCPVTEIWPGIGRNDNGDIYIAGLASLRFNPETLDLHFFDHWSWGVTEPVDVVEDPADGTSIWQARDAVSGSWKFLRYDEVSDIVTTVWADSAGQHNLYPGRFVLDPEGRIATIGLSEVLQFDAANPTNIQSWPTPQQVSTIALDTDGDYLLPEAVYGSGSTRRLWKLDRASGVVTEEIADLNALVPTEYPYTGMSVAPNGKIYLVSSQTTLTEIDRSVPSATLLPFGSPITDIVYFSGTTTAVQEGTVVPRHALALHANVPNPFNPQTTIRYETPRDDHVHLSIFDLRGRLVATLVDRELSAGPHTVQWNGRDARGRAAASGVYLVTLHSGEEVRSRKIALIR